MRYSTDSFIDFMYSQYRAKPLSQCASVDVLEEECRVRRNKLRTVLALDKLENLQHKIKAEQISETEYCIEALPEFAFPIWILRPSSWNGKTVLYISGHDTYGVRGSFNNYGQKNPYHKWLPLKLVDNGYLVFAPELIGFGDMIAENFDDNYNSCFANTEIAQLLGINIMGIRTYQALCAMNFMKTVINSSSIYLYGISGGGFVAALVSALSSDFKAVVISNYGATFKSSIMSLQHCVDNYIPALIKIGEVADIIALGAPKPIMLTNGINDTIFPYNGVQKTVEELDRIYNLFGLSGNFHSHFHNGGHETSVQETIDFFNTF